MNFQKEIIKKLCSFYVSDWHLATMTLPYLKNKLENEEKIITIFEKTIQGRISELLERVSLSEEIKEEIININWETKYEIEYKKVAEYLEGSTEVKNKNLNIFINGKNDYIERVNSNIIRWVEENAISLKSRNIRINIINCYEVTQFEKISEVLLRHDYILNTSGENQIQDVFDMDNEDKVIKMAQ